MTLYFDIDNNKVLSQRPNDWDTRFESFTPSEDITEGYLVYMTYTTYDSFDSSDELAYEVLDFVSEFKLAKSMAMTVSRAEPLFYHNGREKYYPKGWGTAFDAAHILKAEVEEPKEQTYWKIEYDPFTDSR